MLRFQPPPGSNQPFRPPNPVINYPNQPVYQPQRPRPPNQHQYHPHAEPDKSGDKEDSAVKHEHFHYHIKVGEKYFQSKSCRNNHFPQVDNGGESSPIRPTLITGGSGGGGGGKHHYKPIGVGVSSSADRLVLAGGGGGGGGGHHYLSPGLGNRVNGGGVGYARPGDQAVAFDVSSDDVAIHHDSFGLNPLSVQDVRIRQINQCDQRVLIKIRKKNVKNPQITK